MRTIVRYKDGSFAFEDNDHPAVIGGREYPSAKGLTTVEFEGDLPDELVALRDTAFEKRLPSLAARVYSGPGHEGLWHSLHKANMCYRWEVILFLRDAEFTSDLDTIDFFEKTLGVPKDLDIEPYMDRLLEASPDTRRRLERLNSPLCQVPMPVDLEDFPQTVYDDHGRNTKLWVAIMIARTATLPSNKALQESLGDMGMSLNMTLAPYKRWLKN